MVRDGRLELPTSCSQSKRATNCANPGFLVIEFCARCGQTCGQAVFLTTSTCGGSACISGVSRDCGHGIFRLERGASRSQTRRDTNFAIPGYSISAIISRRGRKSKIFLSVVIYVVKPAFAPLSATGESPANAGVARLCGVSPCPVPDSATALPKQARYQLRYTRLLSFLSGWSYSPKPGAIPASLYPDMRVSADKHFAIIAKAAGECKHFLILKKN